MDIKQGLFGVVGTFLGCSIATAGDMGPIVSPQGLHPVVSLQGGYASINAGSNTQRFTGTLPIYLLTPILGVEKTLVLSASF